MVTISVSSKLPTALVVNPMTATAAQHKRLLGKINLIDLAGSENNKLADGKDAGRMAESAAINKSLSVLGQVINAINSGAVRANVVRTEWCSS
jgi:kinesin family protein 22